MTLSIIHKNTLSLNWKTAADCLSVSVLAFDSLAVFQFSLSRGVIFISPATKHARYKSHPNCSSNVANLIRDSKLRTCTLIVESDDCMTLDL